MKHIGIVAHSAEGAALCFRSVCQYGVAVLGNHMHPDVSMSAIAMGYSMEAWESGDMAVIGGLLLEGARRVAASGAEFFVVPDNTAHIALETVAGRFPLPNLHIAEAVCDEAATAQYRTVGVLGTKFTMDGPVYRKALAARGIAHEVPPAAERSEINRIIFEELVHGVFEESSRRFYVQVIDGLRARGCDAVVLGCTEIPLLVSPEDTAVPLLDSTRLLARAAVAHALDRTPASIPMR